MPSKPHFIRAWGAGWKEPLFSHESSKTMLCNSVPEIAVILEKEPVPPLTSELQHGEQHLLGTSWTECTDSPVAARPVMPPTDSTADQSAAAVINPRQRSRYAAQHHDSPTARGV